MKCFISKGFRRFSSFSALFIFSWRDYLVSHVAIFQGFLLYIDEVGVSIRRAEKWDGVWKLFPPTQIFQHFKRWQFSIKLHLNAGEDSGGEPAKGRCVHFHLPAHLVHRPHRQQLGSGRHLEEGADRLEQPDHLRLPGEHGHHVPLSCPPVTLVRWVAAMGLPNLQSDLQSVKAFLGRFAVA